MRNYILAMYDIRGKQEYIFRSGHMKEIMGGSAVIEDCYRDYLYPQAIAYRNERSARLDGKVGRDNDSDAIFNYVKEDDKTFSVEKFRERMSGEQYLGEVVYDGGGNFFVLYRDAETCIEINKRFTRKVLEETAVLKVLCTFIEVDLEDYVGDRNKLYEKHRVYEAREGAVIPAQALPFTQVDYLTSMPLCETVRTAGGRQKVSRESYCKYRKYRERYEKNGGQGELILDNLVMQKGVDSHLAIIYIDGNSMGAKVQQCLNGKKDYDTCVNSLRDFSADIQRIYVDDRKAAVDKYFEDRYKGGEAMKHRRFVVSAGDEINFICKAADAYEVVKAYFAGMPEGHSACAGIAIFHSHAPYSEAYRIAEECCDSGKQKMKKEKLEDVNLMDVHYCQGAIGTELETIRVNEVGELISKPWFIEMSGDKKKAGYIDLETVEKIAGELNMLGRSNVKMLAEHARNSLPKLKMELERIRAHSSESSKLDGSLTFSLLDKDTDEAAQQQVRALIYDIVILYDLWFGKDTIEKGKADE